VRALLLPVGDELYAVELGALHAVVGDPTVFPIPTAPRGVLGAINLRGEIVAVLDTAALLGLGRLDSVDFVAVIDHPAGAVALAAQGRPVTVQLGDQVAPADLAGTLGSFAADSGVATLLDIHALLAPAAA
jgi:purine-binding chemotaxis protein CheW